jgi:hypothetical protein
MNIQQYYRSAANIALNGSFAALIPVFIFIIPIYVVIPKKEMIFLAVPFLIYSFISYQSYILNRERSIGSKTPTVSSHHHDISSKEYLLTFMPAPSLRMMLFHPNGFVNFEICDLRYIKLRWFLPYFLDRLFPVEYGLFDPDGRLFATIKWSGRKAQVYKESGSPLFTVEGKSTQFQISSIAGERLIIVDTKATYTDIQFKNEENQTIGRVRKGWMPLEWGEFFKDANTPVLSFDGSLTEDEKLIILTLLIKLYRYRNH